MEWSALFNWCGQISKRNSDSKIEQLINSLPKVNDKYKKC